MPFIGERSLAGAKIMECPRRNSTRKIGYPPCWNFLFRIILEPRNNHGTKVLGKKKKFTVQEGLAQRRLFPKC